MKYIRTPTGEIYKFDDCTIFDDDLNNLNVFLNAGNQEMLARELFKSTGILVGELKGGENTG